MPDLSTKEEREWWLARANVWLRDHNKPPASTVEEAFKRVRFEVPCTGNPKDKLVKDFPCARCGEFSFPCPDPEGLRLVDDDGVVHEEVYDKTE